MRSWSAPARRSSPPRPADTAEDDRCRRHAEHRSAAPRAHLAPHPSRARPDGAGARSRHPGTDDSDDPPPGPRPGRRRRSWRIAAPSPRRRLLRPRQGRLGDCWVMAPMLALHETAPERLRALLTAEGHGIVTVALPGVATPLRVDRRFPVDEHGVFQYGRRDGANPGWVGALEKAIAAHVAADYAFLQRGFARLRLRAAAGRAGALAAADAERRTDHRLAQRGSRDRRVHASLQRAGVDHCRAAAEQPCVRRGRGQCSTAAMCIFATHGVLSACWSSMPAASGAGSSRWT